MRKNITFENVVEQLVALEMRRDIMVDHYLNEITLELRPMTTEEEEDLNILLDFFGARVVSPDEYDHTEYVIWLEDGDFIELAIY